MSRLVAEGQLDFVNGGYVQHDEATAHYVAMIDQTTRGHKCVGAARGGSRLAARRGLAGGGGLGKWRKGLWDFKGGLSLQQAATADHVLFESAMSEPAEYAALLIRLACWPATSAC